MKAVRRRQPRVRLLFWRMEGSVERMPLLSPAPVCTVTIVSEHGKSDQNAPDEAASGLNVENEMTRPVMATDAATKASQKSSKVEVSSSGGAHSSSISGPSVAAPVLRTAVVALRRSFVDSMVSSPEESRRVNRSGAPTPEKRSKTETPAKKTVRCCTVTSGQVLASDTVISVSDSEGVPETQPPRENRPAASEPPTARQRSRNPLRGHAAAGSCATYFVGEKGNVWKTTPRTRSAPRMSFREITLLHDRIKNHCKRPWTTSEVLREVKQYFRQFEEEDVILHIQSAIMGLQASLWMSMSDLAGAAEVNREQGESGGTAPGVIRFSAAVAKAISDSEVAYLGDLSAGRTRQNQLCSMTGNRVTYEVRLGSGVCATAQRTISLCSLTGNRGRMR